MLQKKEDKKEHSRLITFKNIEVMSMNKDATLDKLTALASHICGVPMAAITLFDGDKQWVRSASGFNTKKTPQENTFCAYIKQQPALVEIEDTLEDDRFKNDQLVTSSPFVRFYAGNPIMDHEGGIIAILSVMDTIPNKLSPAQKESLKLIGESIGEQIINQLKGLELIQFERLFTQSNDLICLMDSQGIVKRTNPAFSQLVYWNEYANNPKHFYSFIHPADLNTAIEARKNLSGASSNTFTSLCQTNKQEEIIIEWVITVEEKTDNVLAIGRDITSERKRELILAESESKFRSFFENSQGLMCIHDTEGNFMSVNSAGAGLLGYTVSEVVQMSLYDLVSSNYHKQLSLYLKRILRYKKANGILNFTHKNGDSRIWMFNNIYEETPDGKSYIIGNAIDITERHKLENDLKHTKEMLEETNQIAGIGGWDFDAINGSLIWSDITKAIHEVPADFIPDLSTAINFYKPGENRDKMAQCIKQGLEERKGWDEELQLITATGKEIWVRAIGSVEFTRGKCSRLFGTLQNIDEKKRATLEVSNSRKQLQDLLQSASEVSIISTDAKGVIKLFNQGAENMLGYSAAEMIDKYTPAIIHDPNEILIRELELSQEFQTPIKGGMVFIYKPQLNGSEQREWTYIKKDGSRISVSLVMSCIRDHAGEITGYLGVATDITANKEAQAALTYEKSLLQSFVEYAPAAVAMLDNSLRYIAVSNRWLEEYKLTGKNLIGKSHYEIFPGVSDHWKTIHQQCLLGHVSKNDEDIWRPDGWDHDQYLKWEVRPWYLLDGGVGGIMMFTQDITQVSLQKEELKLAKKQAEEASVAKSEFLANMSHEIRTPLNGVIGFTDLLLKTEVNETQKQYLSIVNHSGNALLSIINDILDFSKIEAGKLELDIEKCDLFDLGSQAADIISYQVQHKQLELLLNISTDLPRYIWADDIRLKQVLINLLSNATKFTEYGEIELKIHPIGNPSPGADLLQIRFEVRDTGIGIKPDKQGKIFEAFLQEDASTTKKYGGTGLGLTISNQLLHLMGSELQLQSEYGKGSTFFFDLNVKAEQGAPINWEGIENIKHVLIVDDNDNNRLILRQMLLLKQISSDEAKNGIEALTLLSGAHKKYDVIFMDYHMPIMDGIETIRKIRTSFFSSADDQPIILLYSSSSDETVIKACEELDVNHRIVKPLKMQEMFNTLSRLTRKEQGPEEVILQKVSQKSLIENYTVVLVEDNHFNMLLASSIIKRLLTNVNLVEIDNGTDAIAYCKNIVPDIIFMDIQMPVMNGYETTIEIRKIEQLQSTPIIALTAGNLKGERERCVEAGMNDYLAKPIVEKMVADMLGKWLIETPTGTVEIQQNEPGKTRLDLTSLKDLAANDAIFLKEILTIALRDIVASPAIMQNALRTGDIPLLKLKAHSLKSVALSLGSSDLATFSSEIEYAEEIVDAHIVSLLDAIQIEINHLVPLLTEQIEG
jgi:PAS domain S-box-containing protein